MLRPARQRPASCYCLMALVATPPAGRYGNGRALLAAAGPCFFR